MSKRVLLCTDGTWDDSGKNTNVYKLYKAAEVSADQITAYDDGVGASGQPIDRLLGGAFGTGLYKKIKDGYAKIAHVYEKGDEVFLFGFSRGAYTARSIAGMIACCGLPTKNFTDDVVETAFDAYRNKDRRAGLLARLNASCEMSDGAITMIGVWDTVGSLGIPAVFGGVDPLVYGFLDTSLNPKVRHAYHALAIDERRGEFPPTLWTSQPASGQTVEQVWFSGVHCDIGGSYPDDPDGTALADITLAWMMSKAAALGVRFDAEAMKEYVFPVNPKCALDVKHESWNLLWAFPKKRSIPADAWLSNSVAIRCEHDETYRPGNLAFLKAGGLSSKYRIVATAGVPEAVVAAPAAFSATT